MTQPSCGMSSRSPTFFPAPAFAPCPQQQADEDVPRQDQQTAFHLCAFNGTDRQSDALAGGTCSSSSGNIDEALSGHGDQAIRHQQQHVLDMVRRDTAGSSGWCGVVSRPPGGKHHRAKRGCTAPATKPASDNTTADKSKWLIFEVADTGVGVAEDGLRALFKEFIQVRAGGLATPAAFRLQGGAGP